MKQRRIEDPFDATFPDWWPCDLYDMRAMFGSKFHTVKETPDGSPDPWYLFGRPYWRLCEVRKWVRDVGGIEVVRGER